MFPPSAHGIWMQPLQAWNWLGVIGASLAPKSTVPPCIPAIPPLEPIDPYVILIPYAEFTAGIHCDTSGNTNELPAPVRLPALADADDAGDCDARVIAAAAPTAASATASARLATTVPLLLNAFLL